MRIADGKGGRLVEDEFKGNRVVEWVRCEGTKQPCVVCGDSARFTESGVLCLICYTTLPVCCKEGCTQLVNWDNLRLDGKFRCCRDHSMYEDEEERKAAELEVPWRNASSLVNT